MWSDIISSSHHKLYQILLCYIKFFHIISHRTKRYHIKLLCHFFSSHNSGIYSTLLSLSPLPPFAHLSQSFPMFMFFLSSLILFFFCVFAFHFSLSGGWKYGKSARTKFRSDKQIFLSEIFSPGLCPWFPDEFRWVSQKFEIICDLPFFEFYYFHCILDGEIVYDINIYICFYGFSDCDSLFIN